MTDPQAAAPDWPAQAIYRGDERGLELAAIEPRRTWYESRAGGKGETTRLALLAWSPPAGAEPRGTVIVLHGVQSHAGWYHGLGRRLAAAGFEALFPDRRGSGANAQQRGHATSGNQLGADLAGLARPLRLQHGGLPIVVAGVSWGGKLAVLMAAEYPLLVDGVALLCPGLKPRVGVKTSERLRIAQAVLTRRLEQTRLPIPLADPALFTAHLAAQQFIAQDPLSLREATAGLLYTSFQVDRRLKGAAAKVRQPCLLMLASEDRIVDNTQTRDYFDRIASRDKTVIEYPGCHHTLEFEPDPGQYVRDLIAWIERTVLQRQAVPRTSPAESQP